LSMLMRNAEWLMPKDIDVTKRYVPKSVDQLSSTDSSTAPTQPAPKEESQEQAGDWRPEAGAKPMEAQASSLTPQASEKLLLLGAKTPEVSTPIAPTQTTIPFKVPDEAGGVRLEENQRQFFLKSQVSPLKSRITKSLSN